jgi:hypothetical protein
VEEGEEREEWDECQYRMVLTFLNIGQDVMKLNLEGREDEQGRGRGACW